VPKCQTIENGGFDQYGKVQSLNEIGGERVNVGLYIITLHDAQNEINLRSHE